MFYPPSTSAAPGKHMSNDIGLAHGRHGVETACGRRTGLGVSTAGEVIRVAVQEREAWPTRPEIEAFRRYKQSVVAGCVALA